MPEDTGQVEGGVIHSAEGQMDQKSEGRVNPFSFLELGCPPFPSLGLRAQAFRLELNFTAGFLLLQPADSAAKILPFYALMPSGKMRSVMKEKKRVALFLCQAKRDQSRLAPQELYPPRWGLGRGLIVWAVGQG